MRAAGLFAGILMLAAGSSGAVLALDGRADVVDGDTIKVSGTVIRLQGVDAPESLQTCSDRGGREWACGKAATQALSRFLKSQPASCEPTGKDRYGRLLAFCRVGSVDLNRWLVSSGWAWAFVKYDARYAGEEAQARSAHLGIWKGKAEAPWNWRAGKVAEAPAAAEADGGCRIKGNVSAKGERIYHLPFQHAYGKTRINVASGERWFCSESEAMQAGWRRALQ